MSKNEPEDDERGVIINTASIAAFEGQIGQVAYTAAKAASPACASPWPATSGRWGSGSTGDRAKPVLDGYDPGIPDEMDAALTKDAAFPKRMGRPNEYAKLVAAIIENPMLNGRCIRLDAGQRFAPK